MALPKRLWRVEWDAAVGYPEPERRQRTVRNYGSEANAGRQLAIIEAMPSHLALVAVHVTECTWTEVDANTIPRPEGEQDQ